MCGDSKLLPGGDDNLGAWSILGDPRQRRILSILQECSHPMTERDLAIHLAARETGSPPSEVSEDEHHGIRVDLRHRCLPKLEAVGLIEREPEGLVATDPFFSPDGDSSLPVAPDADLHSWEAVDALLARPRRQEIVSIVASTGNRLTLAELATELETSSPTWTELGEDDGLGIPGTLHHIDLPKLAMVGLIEYDPDDKTMTRTHTLEWLVDRTDFTD